MATGTKKTNPVLMDAVTALRTAGRENGAPIWRDIASRLEGPSRHWAQVNVSKLDAYVRDGENAVVAGKVLGSGDLARPITVVAFQASASAKAKIAAAGGKVLTMEEGLDAFPKGEKCRIIG